MVMYCRHSLARINAYRALASPSLICLSSKNPLMTAFSLSDDLEKTCYTGIRVPGRISALRTQVLQFAMRLVDETRSSDELEIVLNYDPEGEPYKKGQFMHLNRLKDAVDNNQKQFVAHASVQQLLGRCGTTACPASSAARLLDQLMAVVKIGVLFPSTACPSFWAPKNILRRCSKLIPMNFSESPVHRKNKNSLISVLHFPYIHSARFCALFLRENPHMGPLQISLGRMVVDIQIFSSPQIVLFASVCGLNNLLWYYADIDKSKCYSLPNGLPNPTETRSCEIWRRFSNLFETSQSLFWASFGLVDLINFELTGIKSFTRFWSMLMFGSYNVINVIVLLNLLIAMMSNSYTFIVTKCDVEWKFARSKFWMSYFEEGQELPSPFNLFPKLSVLCEFGKPSYRASFKKRQDQMRDDQYQTVMKNLVRRYVTAEQRNMDEELITEDDVNEVKQDINSFKYELLNILRINGMMTGNAHHREDMAVGKKQQARERRLMKGFNIGLVEGIEQSMHFGNKKSKNSLLNIVLKQATNKTEKKDWNTMMRASMKKRDPIGSSRTSLQRQSLRNKKRCNAAWSKVKFYQKRGVFLGGQIDPRMLREIKNRGQVAPLQSRSLGWRTLQQLHDRGEITQENFDKCVRNTPSPGSTAAPTPIPPTSPRLLYLESGQRRHSDAATNSFAEAVTEAVKWNLEAIRNGQGKIDVLENNEFITQNTLDIKNGV
ncbi:LOW QUALITY PROTEIN: transient-receptor-potential-like protein [Penaeus monodon]|uniref:LOW QUALITY PROTEIN: transient-receptor-potential-like protein n=1 Tax=Penaeus monodon TaxID=6687 RepID=UPI0018A73D03|nr:LOW QUALITY PROTEIN: transient-receptor-potential-like protein [Penaeus monodon]